MSVPADFWKPWERVANSYNEVVDFIETVRTRWGNNEKDRMFAWRGVVNADWALDSSLHRRLAWTTTGSQYPDESALYEAESDILREVHRWALHWHAGARLPILSQLAMLQHFGSPTRLIDISFNAWIGVWFAVEQKWQNGKEEYADCDGRLFAIDVSNHIINEHDEFRDWEDETHRPWPKKGGAANTLSWKDWITTVYAWRPSHLDARISAQNGGFLFGGIPGGANGKGNRKFWPKDRNSKRNWSIDEVRRSTSVALRPHLLEPNCGKRADNPLFTLRITARAKPEIRDHLTRFFGYEHRTIYPDYSGFAQFGTPTLRQWPSRAATSSNPTANSQPAGFTLSTAAIVAQAASSAAAPEAGRNVGATMPIGEAATSTGAPAAEAASSAPDKTAQMAGVAPNAVTES